jgi:hypothetical protein
MRVSRSIVDNLSIQDPSGDFTAYFDLRSPSLLVLTLVASDQAWTAEIPVNGELYASLLSQATLCIAVRLAGVAELPLDVERLTGEIRLAILRGRHRRELTRQRARAMFNNVELLTLAQSADELPDALMELRYGPGWRLECPRMIPSEVEVLRCKVDLLVQAIQQIKGIA